MKLSFNNCKSCSAFHLLTDERKIQIETWEHKKQNNIDRIKEIKLILIGESMPSMRYFYDINSDYENDGMRFNLKQEFGKQNITDSEFLEFFRRKGIIMHDCAFCPIHKLETNAEKRSASTHCLLNYNLTFIDNNQNTPLVTIFPSNRGWLKNKISDSIKKRIIAELSFENVSGLKELYNQIK